MKTLRCLTMLCSLFALLLLAACSSDSSNSNLDPTVSGGTAVDPYIVGAVFEEIGFDGAVLQESLPSDAQGRFTFPELLTQGSVIEMKSGTQGTHNGTAYEGTLKRVVDAEGLLVASPLTTLLANGFTADQVLAILSTVGIEGLQEADLKADPMVNLEQVNVTGNETVEFDALLPLQANMAVNAFMAAMEKRGAQGYDVTPEEVEANLELLTDVAAGVQEIFSLATILQAAQDVAAAAGAELPVSLVDIAATAVAVTDYVVNRLAIDPTADPLMIVQELKASGAISNLLLANALASAPENSTGTESDLLPNLPEISPDDTFSLGDTGEMYKNGQM